MKSILKSGIVLTLILIGNCACSSDLIGHWTFESGEELIDKTENFGDLQLKNSKVANGYLYMDSAQLAYATDYSGPNFGPDKTMVIWLYLDDLDAISGVTFAIEAYGQGRFDAVLYHIPGPYKWGTGSELWQRSSLNNIGAEETEINSLIQLAVTHQITDDGLLEVVIYRNGKIYNSFKKSNQVQYYTGSTNVKFGFVGNSAEDYYTWINCRVEEVQLYDRALSQDEINTLEIKKVKTTNRIWWILGSCSFLLLFILLLRFKSRLSAQ